MTAPTERPQSPGDPELRVRRERRTQVVTEEWERLPRDTNGGRKVLTIGVAVVLVFAFVVGAGFLWVSRKMNPPGDPGELVASIEVPTGSSTDSIARILADADVISDAGLFSRYVGLKSAGPWEAGNYTDFRLNSSFDEAIEVLDGGPLPVGATQVRITEGKRVSDAITQIAEQHPNVDEEALLLALGSGEVTSQYLPERTTSWEGLLFPDTYEFSDDATATEILQTLADEMSDNLDELGYDRAETLRGYSAYDVLKVASLAERETGQPEEERGQISRVIYNRLDENEPLGIDAAVLYGLGRDSGELTQSDLDTDTPYNTRINPGLPPTPIGLPSMAALSAAIDPPEGNWRYYVLVSNDPPSHLFTNSYQEFQRAKAQAQADGVF
ncbi:MAG: endolytic transglycosylase MltG [Microthrixaceae bacterium]